KVDMHFSKIANHEKKIIGLEKTPMPSKSVKESIEHMSVNTIKGAQPEKNMTSNDKMKTESSDSTLNDRDSEVLTKIIELRSQGNSLPQIAKELGIGMGELQLLIALKK
ncbi:MAG TPA: hypothetical protein VLS94_00005, partial [Fusibacter sp.]|nr:hypothetical protein [Fusibacter sp.]